MSTGEINHEFEALLEHLKQSRGFDFTGYKRSSLMRRINKRMQEISVESYSDYVDYLEVHPDEFVFLFNTILINVTAFFRDQAAWDYLSTEVVPRIVARKELNQPIRIWSAGCASGEEAYTLAMVIAEAIGVEQYQARVKIYATDADEEALTHARHATYDAREIASIPPALLEKYFEPSNQQSYVFHKDLRRSVIFGRHNLVEDAPISRIDLLVCRNTLMYFNAEAQAKILTRFHFALNDGGFLFLGKAEMLLTHASIFTPVNLRRRVFIKVERAADLRDQLVLVDRTSNEDNVNHLTSRARVQEAAFDASLVAQVVVDRSGFLVLVNERARTLFNLVPADLGRPLHDLEFSYRPVELRSCIEQAYVERRSINLVDIELPTSFGNTYYLDLQVTPLVDVNGSLLGTNITFTDVTRYKRLQDELEHSNQELEMAYEELQSTNEELETTNEELQSTVEELETTNEELQSTNEELETMNEELQSTNEELETTNEELSQRSEAFNQANAFLAAILHSLRGGVAVLDRDLCIQTWNNKAGDLWGLRLDEIQGQHLLNLDIGLPVEQLRQPVRACLAGEIADYQAVLEAINRRGKMIQCRVTCTPLADASAEIEGVILLMEEEGSMEPS